MVVSVFRAVMLGSMWFSLTITALAQDDPPSPIAVSPDGSLIVDFRLADRQPQYRVRHDNDDLVLGWSDLGLTYETIDLGKPDAPVLHDFSSNVRRCAVRHGEFRDDYEMVTGKRRHNTVHANSLEIELCKEGSPFNLIMEFLAFDDGFAFRYRMDDRSDVHTRIVEESTSFLIGKEATHYGQPYDHANTWMPSYEARFHIVRAGTDAGDVGGVGWSFPSLFQTANDNLLLLHEAGLSRSFHGTHLAADPVGGEYKIAPPLADSAMGHGLNSVSTTLPMSTSWRFGVIGSAPSVIAESNRVFDLARASVLDDTAWIKPGLSSWSWWSDSASSKNAPSLERFIDLSAKMGWPYSLVDANWNTISDTAMEDLVSYAEQRRVGLFFWYNSGGRHNAVTEQPRNIMSDPDRRQAEFARLAELGVAGVKIDFFHSDKQDMIGLYHDVLVDAAEHQIMVNFHGSTIPRGWERTYPHLMTMEAVRGAETYKYNSARKADFGRNAPAQNVLMVFTRNVIGSMDYTPVSYTIQPVARTTTNAHETALVLVFESGIQHMSDSVEAFESVPKAYKDFFGIVPAAWDETRLLAGSPDDYAVIARQHDGRWFVGAINGLDESVEVEVTLPDAMRGKSYTLLMDDEETSQSAFPSAVMEVPENGIVVIDMAPFGGAVLY